MKKHILMMLIFICSALFAETSFYDDHARGWHWYETMEQEHTFESKDRKKISRQKEYSATQELKDYQEILEEAKALAVLYPTPRNVLSYQKLQYEMLRKSGEFAETWMQNIYQNPSLDFTQQFPVSQKARHIYLAEKQRSIEEQIRKLSKKYGLFFFYKNNCPYCDAFSPIVKAFSDKYEWEVLAISEFGEEHDLFKRNVRDNGLADTWGVNTYPSLFAVNPKTGHVLPIAVGMISIQEMEDRIMAIASIKEATKDDV